ncbi:uncharacterized protein [Amphiura filiformis]|uniref:uncharacterized protein n=1 Tax=Amphiura filiformis TaxID=82378 RepID=UPI003B2112B7
MQFVNKAVGKIETGVCEKKTWPIMSHKSNLFRQKNPKNKQTKVHLVFDEESRRDFLTGFRKRKLERKKIAREKLEEREKEEKRLKRQERKKILDEKLKNIKLPELQTEEDDDPVVFNHPEHTVTVTTVTQVDLLAEHGSVGENKVEYESDYYDDEPRSKKPNLQELADAESEEKREKKKRMSAIKKANSRKKFRQKAARGAAREQKSQIKNSHGREKRRLIKAQGKRSGKKKGK